MRAARRRAVRVGGGAEFFRSSLSAILFPILLLWPLVGAAAGPKPPAAKPNGFALEALKVERAAIIAGGPTRAEISSVDAPGFAPADEARSVRAGTPHVGVSIDGEAHCYPVHVMEYHQVVNDLVAGVALVITYDPLTDSAMAYRSQIGESRLTFGVSGLIHRSNFLLYDREGESLWAQFTGRALPGPRAGQRRQWVRTRVESFARWRERPPETTVLRLPQPRRFDYRYSNYSSYWNSETIPFPVESKDPRFHPKELVLGVESGDHSRAYVASILERAGGRIVDEFAGARIRVEYDGETATFRFEAPDSLHVIGAYWFAWKEFHPDTEIWNEAPDDPENPSATGDR